MSHITAKIQSWFKTHPPTHTHTTETAEGTKVVTVPPVIAVCLFIVVVVVVVVVTVVVVVVVTQSCLKNCYWRCCSHKLFQPTTAILSCCHPSCLQQPHLRAFRLFPISKTKQKALYNIITLLLHCCCCCYSCGCCHPCSSHHHHHHLLFIFFGVCVGGGGQVMKGWVHKVNCT